MLPATIFHQNAADTAKSAGCFKQNAGWYVVRCFDFHFAWLQPMTRIQYDIRQLCMMQAQLVNISLPVSVRSEK